MRIASYNVLHGKPVHNGGQHATDTGSAANPQHLTNAVRLIAPDILGVQEIDRFQIRSGDVDQSELVAEAMDAQSWRFVPTVVGTPGGRGGFRSATVAEIANAADRAEPGVPQYGIALMSRLPVRAWKTKILPPAPMSLPLLVQTEGRPRIMRVRDEQRAAIAAIVETDSGPLTVVVTHLSFVPGFNIRQLRTVTRWMATMPTPAVLIGDFNLPNTIPQRISGLTSIIGEATFPSYRPRVQLDHILARDLPTAAITTMRESARAISAGVSDHCAAVADLGW